MKQLGYHTDVIGGAIFGLLGLLALYGVIFKGATHQIFTLFICAVMCWALLSEANEMRKEETIYNNNDDTDF